MEYYFLGGNLKHNTAFAWTENSSPVAYELIPDFIDKTESPFDLVLVKLIKKRSGFEISRDLTDVKYTWTDFPGNNLAWPIMSERMKDIIEKNLTGKESIRWIKINIKSVDEIRIYFIPFFEKQLDVLDNEHTSFVKGTTHIIRPCFSIAKIQDYSMFYRPQSSWQITSSIYVNEVVKKALQNQKITGIKFEKTMVL